MKLEFKLSKWTKRAILAGLVTIAVLWVSAYPQVGEAEATAIAPSLGEAESFAVLGSSSVTNTGPSSVTGNLGVSPDTAITGVPPGIVNSPGTIHSADTLAEQAQSAVTAAYDNLTNQTCNFDWTGQDLGGKTLTPGVYCFSSSAELTGALTLDAQNDPGAVFVFQIGDTLTTASASSVVVINGGNDCNVFWQVGSSATLGATTAFKGNILALTNITLTTGATIDAGRTFARNGAVTMDTNDVSLTGCSAAAASTPTPDAPTNLDLVAFSAHRTATGNIRVKWETGSELNTMGFIVERATKINGTFKQLNPTMLAAKNIGGIQGAKYAFNDKPVKPGKTYFYKLEIMKADGTSEWSDVIEVN